MFLKMAFENLDPSVKLSMKQFIAIYEKDFVGHPLYQEYWYLMFKTLPIFESVQTEI